MVTTVTKFSFIAALACMTMLWHGSMQMPTQARTKRGSICDRKLQSPTVERDLLLGLRTMYIRGILNNARNVSINILSTWYFTIYYSNIIVDHMLHIVLMYHCSFINPIAGCGPSKPHHPNRQQLDEISKRKQQPLFVHDVQRLSWSQLLKKFLQAPSSMEHTAREHQGRLHATQKPICYQWPSQFHHGSTACWRRLTQSNCWMQWRRSREPSSTLSGTEPPSELSTSTICQCGSGDRQWLFDHKRKVWLDRKAFSRTGKKRHRRASQPPMQS